MVNMIATVSVTLWFILMFLESVKDNIRLPRGVVKHQLTLESIIDQLGHRK